MNLEGSWTSVAGVPMTRSQSGRTMPVASLQALEQHRHATMFGPGSRLRLCGAKSKRTGQPCKAPAMKGSKRCKFHGGMTAERAHSKPTSERVRRNRLAAHDRRWGARLRELGPEIVAELRETDPEGLQAIRKVWARMPKDLPAGHLYVRLQSLREARQRVRERDRGAEIGWNLAVGFATYSPGPDAPR